MQLLHLLAHKNRPVTMLNITKYSISYYRVCNKTIASLVQLVCSDPVLAKLFTQKAASTKNG